MDEVRVDSDPNLLITSLSFGLKDRYVQAALRARSFVDVVFTTPMTFFTHSNAVNRSQIRRIMDCAAEFIEQISVLSPIGLSALPIPICIDFIAKLVLAKLKCPKLQAE
jgi:hypothetical protein